MRPTSCSEALSLRFAREAPSGGAVAKLNMLENPSEDVHIGMPGSGRTLRGAHYVSNRAIVGIEGSHTNRCSERQLRNRETGPLLLGWKHDERSVGKLLVSDCLLDCTPRVLELELKRRDLDVREGLVIQVVATVGRTYGPTHLAQGPRRPICMLAAEAGALRQIVQRVRPELQLCQDRSRAIQQRRCRQLRQEATQLDAAQPTGPDEYKIRDALTRFHLRQQYSFGGPRRAFEARQERVGQRRLRHPMPHS